MTTTRKQHSPKFKAQVVLEAIRGEKTLSQLGSQFKVHPIQIAKWRKSALEAMASIVASVQRSTLNARDAALQHKGYYEKLDNTSRMSAHLWDVTAQKPANWLPLSATRACRVWPDFLGWELRPNTSITFMGQAFTTNSWGMHDRERTLSKPAGVYRIALLGPSHVMGSGVSDADTFARLLEEQLNRSGNGNVEIRYEVLNFGVAGYALTQQLAILEDRVLTFEPDAVFFTDSPRLAAPTMQHLLRAVEHRQGIPFPRLQELLQETGMTALGRPGVPMLFDAGRVALESLGMKTRMPWPEAEQRLRRSADRVIRVTLEQMAEVVRSHGAVPVFVALGNVEEPPQIPVPALLNPPNLSGLVSERTAVNHLPGQFQKILKKSNICSLPYKATLRFLL